MRRVVLTRTETGDEGTFGEIVVDGFRCVTLELPWRANAKGRSCIPAGTYVFRWRTDSPAHGACYEADVDEEAPGRTNIQIHSANLAGDVDLGYVAQLLGCIAPGQAVVTFGSNVKPAGELPQRGVAGSRGATAELENVLRHEPFELQIAWAPGVGPQKPAFPRR